MPDYFAAFLDLRGRRCVIVGGGPIAARKTEALLEAGARVTVVSPALTPALAALVAARRVVHRPRRFLTTDVRGCALAVAATGVERVDAAVAAAARRHRALVNVVDRPALCDFIVPSVLRRGELQIAVSTGGRVPALAREIRKSLEPLFAPACANFVARVGEARARAREGVTSVAERMAAGERVVALALGERGRAVEV
ncbi:MAG TPA: bifunctional precorrin-2 dehydrogenase/sirohydrochlorin ferrochelatase [Methylomirabilota bacterium]|jgi:siroheme synthase-like protein|nr:bifunctional precorrin-2 dehydrogenase/sirohydrochlorin ferrochelatase [Methylomirabilota bacterium]